MVQAGIKLETLWDVYRRTWLPFGALLTDMEAVGMAVDRPHLAAAQVQAEADQQQAKDRFRWVAGGGQVHRARRFLCVCQASACRPAAVLPAAVLQRFLSTWFTCLPAPLLTPQELGC